MKAVICTQYGPPEVLQIQDVDRPVCKDNEILIRIMAASVNSRDVKVPAFILKVGSLFNKQLSKLQDLLLRYVYDNQFDASKFSNRFPEFRITSYSEGKEQIKVEG